MALFTASKRSVSASLKISAEKPVRRNACSICSASPQISESKPVRPASNTPTTVQSREAKRSVSPRPAPWKPLGDRASGDDLGGARPEHPALDHAAPAGAARARWASRRGSRRSTACPMPRLGRLMSTTGSLEISALPSSPIAMSGRLSTMPACVRSIAALHLGLRAAADDDHVVVLTGRDQRLLESRREHQHRREHVDHQRHAAGGQRRW